MKILFISSATLLGGAELYFYKVVCELHDRGFNLQAIVNSKSKIRSRLIANNVLVQEEHFGTSFGRARGWVGTLSLIDQIANRRLKSLLQIKQREGYSVVVFNDPREQIIGSKIAKELGFKVVWLMHSPFHFFLNYWFGYPLLRIASSYVDHALVEANYLKDQLVNHGISESKIKICSNFVDLHYIDSIVSPSDVFCLPKVTIGYIGRLAKGKGVEILLQAFSSVLPQIPQIELVIAGTGPQGPHLKAISERLNLGDKVSFVGFLENPLLLMARLDIFVNPSYDRGEVLPTNILEAFALKRIVIATEHAGIPEILSHQYNGIMIPKQDIEALKDALLTVTSMGEQSHVLGNNARETLVGKYEKTSVIDNIIYYLLN